MTRNLDTTGVSPGTAIYLANSSENPIAQNTLNSNAANGLELAGSKFNLIFGHTANTNRKSGVRLDAGSSHNMLRKFAPQCRVRSRRRQLELWHQRLVRQCCRN